MDKQPTPEKILQTGLAFWPAKTLLSAIELGVFTELAEGPRSLPDSRYGRPAPALGARLLRHARRAGFLARAGDRYATRLNGALPGPQEALGRAAASSRWRIIASIRSGAPSPRRCGPGSRKTRSRAAARACSKRSMPIRRA